jgi:response regulator RpfG family c-di-GMP phosphodiesterase
MTERLNILVVDDDPAILEVFADSLSAAEDYSIITASDGEEALEICRSSKVDFCFTDLRMPEMDGIELVSKIHGVDNTIPVVVMTGYPSSESAIATLKNGVVDFLVKPFKMDGIRLTIRNVLEKRALLIENMLLKQEVKSKQRLASVNLELSEKVNDLKVLNLILQKVDWVRNSAVLFDLIVKLTGDITGSDESYFHIFDETVERPVLVASFSRDGKKPNQNNLPGIEEALVKRASEGIPFLMKDPSDLSVSNSDIRSLLATPLRIREEIFGMVTAAKVKEGSAPFTEKDLYYLDFLARRTAFVIENVALYENIYDNLFSTLYAFVEAIEARDPYTKQHSSRVAEIALDIGKEMDCSQEELNRLSFSGYLHDIGKIGIRDSILLKPGRLTDEEFEVIKKHPTIGASIIGHLGLMSEEQKVIRHHHERWDGSGYPDGLQGEAIPFLSRILAVADVYDAMASDRAYRKKIADEVIIENIRQNAGTQFDARVVNGFLRVSDRGELLNKKGSMDTHHTEQRSKRLEVGVLGKLSCNTNSFPV